MSTIEATKGRFHKLCCALSLSLALNFCASKKVLKSWTGQGVHQFVKATPGARTLKN